MKKFFNDLSLSSFVAGLVSLLVGFSSSAVIVYQAATKAGASDLVASSWLGLLCVSMGLLTLILSYQLKKPVMFAWSTAGGALLFSSVEGFSMPEIIGAFILSALFIFLSGITKIFEKMMNKIPLGIASAMLAGVLLHFSLDIFPALKSEPLIVSGMILTYVMGKFFFPRLNIVLVLIIGSVLSIINQKFLFPHYSLSIIEPVWTSPLFTMKAFLAIGFPLFVVTMASQNLTGIAVMRTYGYQTNISHLISWSGFVNLLIAPFGGYSLNLSALTAAICMGPDSHVDPQKRYTSAMMSGLFYIIVGLFAGAIISLFTALPKELIMTLAGLALMGTVSQGLLTALTNHEEKEASMMTFFVTASGVSFIGISSAFWGLIAGLVVLVISKIKIKKGN
jgi:benzoate membrane transport protein